MEISFRIWGAPFPEIFEMIIVVVINRILDVPYEVKSILDRKGKFRGKV